ncbi:MAG TPA: superoxide dismutase family protein [Planctomycetota bacterium]|nr:superoxide dismutase family protein [Planctomycetota bacterium]
MSRIRLFGTLIATAALGACSDAPQPRVWGAWADLINTSGTKIGEVQFAEREKNGVVLRLQAWSLPPGSHGLHIHDSGTCETPEFQTAGGHFNPFGKKHGLLNPQGPHAGDLPNLVVPSSGKIDVTFDLPSLTLRDGHNSLLQRNGTSIVIHANPDDGISDPAGNSGARIACGVIRSLNPPEINTR